MNLNNFDFDTILLIATLLILVALVWDLSFLLKKLSKRSRNTFSVELNRKIKPPNIFLRISEQVWKHKLLLANFIIPVIAFGLISMKMSVTPSILYSFPTPETNWQDYSEPIQIVFNIPVDTSRLLPFLSREELQGEWVYEPYLGFLPVTREARFYPSNTLEPDRRLVVYMTGVGRVGVAESHEHTLNFYTHQLPEIFSTYPVNEQSAVQTDVKISFKLNRANNNLAEWAFEATPEFDFRVEQKGEQEFLIIPSTELNQTETYTISAFRTPITVDRLTGEVLERDNSEMVHEITFTTVKAPLVKKFSPTGTGVKVDSNIEIKFEVEMDRSSVEQRLLIEPFIETELAWEGNNILTLSPTSEFPKETQYTVTLAEGLQSLTGGISEQEIKYNLTTIGAVRVSKFNPKKSTVRVLRDANIVVTFDQEVNHASAQSKFSISPNINGKFSWKDNKMTFNPSSRFKFKTKYTVKINKGVKTIYGLDSREVFSTSFTTVPNQTVLGGFSWDKQDSNFTCGVAATKMVLARKGIYRSESTLIQQMGHDTSTFVYNASNPSLSTWGNPNKAFLGWPNGSGDPKNRSAYGVHWSPIINMLSSKYGIQTQLHRNWNLKGIAQEIHKGHPVQIWWWNGVSSYYGANGASRVYWKDNQTGETVEALQGMHSILVIGYNGDVDNPTSFIVLDPWWGYNTYSAAKFKVQWPPLRKTGLVIY